MERVKDLSKVVLRGDAILAELKEKKSKSGLILPESTHQQNYADYIEVIAVGDKILDIKPGDIILDVGGEISTFLVHSRRVTIIYRGSVVVVVHPDNFDPSYKPTESDSKLII